CWYGMVCPDELRGCVSSMTIFVTRACAHGNHARSRMSAAMPIDPCANRNLDVLNAMVRSPFMTTNRSNGVRCGWISKIPARASPRQGPALQRRRAERAFPFLLRRGKNRRVVRRPGSGDIGIDVLLQHQPGIAQVLRSLFHLGDVIRLAGRPR